MHSMTTLSSVLVADGRVKALVETGTAEKLARNALIADRVLEEYRRLAFADIRTFFDANGNLLPVQDLDEEQGACLASFEVRVQ
jgi:phage terminase small subunit